MPKSAKLLFIGGPSDGQTFATDQKKMTVSVKTTQGKGAKSQSTQYIRETIKCGGAKVEVMRHKELKPEDLIARLLSAYDDYEFYLNQ
jgi:hypothetical protein